MILCGMDEAGRGALAGPVVAGAVILPHDFPPELLTRLNDSKKLSEKERSALEPLIKRHSFWGAGVVDHNVIDSVNILRASLLAMELAFKDLCGRLSERAGTLLPRVEALADGTFCPNVPVPCRAEAKADGRYPAVMAASIIAKTCRDAIMRAYDADFPGYGYARHKGYPTKAHREACLRLGGSPIQRLSFRVQAYSASSKP